MNTPASVAGYARPRIRISLLILLLAIAIGSAFAITKNRKAASVQTPTISFLIAPEVVPRNQPTLNYSPLVAVSYSGLEVGTYVVRVHLLETDPPSNFLCGCTTGNAFWCPAVFTIDNQTGTNASGTIFDARLTDIHDYGTLLWKAELFKKAEMSDALLLVSDTTRAVTSTSNRAPVLNSVGNKTASVGQSLDFTVSASDPESDAVSFTAQNLPAGATFNGTTGQFHWQPSATGTVSNIIFIATQLGPTPLSDAEIIEIEVGASQPAGELAFSTATSTTGESGPAFVYVSRTNGTAGAVSVAYSTVNGSANSGADYTSVSNGVLSFANGEVTKSIRLNILNDAVVETNENFQVILSSPTGGATLGAQSQSTINIVDDDTPSLAGQWSGVNVWPTVPIHMHLLPNGKVMFWDRHSDHHNPTWDVTPHLWDPLNPGVFTKLPLPDWDIFCSGHTLMADGRLFVAGGHVHDFVGAQTAGIYDSDANTWTALPNMNAGRWYPTTTILPNGDLFVIAGTKAGYGDINQIPQIFQVNSGTWRSLSNAPLGPYPVWPDLYPYSYVAPNGKIFIAGPQRMARYLDTTGTGTWSDVANSSLCYRDYGSSVMYNDGKVLNAGGNPRDDCDPNIPRPIFPSASAEVIDLNVTSPSWRNVSPMLVGRRHLNTTILPDGKVLVTGGSSAPGHDDPAGAVFFAELWDPATEIWTPVAGHTRYRGYHSNALLLPDARVLIAGGGHPDPVGGNAENNAEIYSPPYLFKGARPMISSAPSVVTYGQAFSVQTPDAVGVTQVNWIRLASVTHAFNESQRINRLTFSQGSGGLNVTAPASAGLCPPGHYMLFVLNGSGVPSVARIVQIVDSLVEFDAPTFSVGEGGGSAVITVRRRGATNGSVSVNYATSDGTGKAGSDFTDSAGTLTFGDGETVKTFSIPIINDNALEDTETVNLVLSNAIGVTLGQTRNAILNIADNDSEQIQLLLEESPAENNLVAALDSVLFVRDPFLVFHSGNLLNPPTDRNTRLTIFTANLPFAPGDPASTVVVQLTDSSNAVHAINAEDVRIVPGFNFTQIIFRLPGSLPAGTCSIKVLAKGQTSNSVNIRVQ